MSHFRAFYCAGLIVAMSQSLAEEPLAVCGVASKTLDDGCWQPLEHNPTCHVWDAMPETIETARFEGKGRCRHGKLSGTGILTWTLSENGEPKHQTITGQLSAGKLHGQIVIEGHNGSREEGRYINGQKQGIWTVSHAHGTDRWWDWMEGHVADGMKQGDWKLMDYDSDGVLIEEQYGSFVNDEKHGDWLERDYVAVRGAPVLLGHAQGPYVRETIDPCGNECETNVY